MPSGSLTSSASERFERFAAKNMPLPPGKNCGPHARASSPRSGCSTLTTSAPRPPRISVHVGPASDEVRSTTRTPASGANVKLEDLRAPRLDVRDEERVGAGDGTACQLVEARGALQIGEREPAEIDGAEPGHVEGDV